MLIFESLRLPLTKGSSTFLTKPIFPQGREDVTALRYSEPLRYKVGGPIKGLTRYKLLFLTMYLTIVFSSQFENLFL